MAKKKVKNTKSRRKKLTYVGLRHFHNNQFCHRFIDHRGTEYNYSRLTGCWIGHTYWSEPGDRMKKYPQEVENHPVDETKVAVWKAEDVAAKAMRARNRAANSIEKMDIWRTPLCELYKKYEKMGFYEKRAFAEEMIHLMSRGRK